MSNPTVRITDRVDPARTALVDGETAGPVIGHWLTVDGAMTAKPSPNVTALVLALHHGDWAAVHAMADHLSISVEVLA